MDRKMTADEKRDEIIRTELSGAFAIYLFGSAARNELRADSDIDIAFLSNETYSPLEIYHKSQELADKLQRPVDLINLKNSSTVFAFQVISKGRKILLTDKHQSETFEYLAYSSYARLNEERQEILKQYGEVL
jgi:predicted nucleotidyltransferase